MDVQALVEGGGDFVHLRFLRAGLHGAEGAFEEFAGLGAALAVEAFGLDAGFAFFGDGDDEFFMGMGSWKFQVSGFKLGRRGWRSG
jgi:hypothetical protein